MTQLDGGPPLAPAHDPSWTPPQTTGPAMHGTPQRAQRRIPLTSADAIDAARIAALSALPVIAVLASLTGVLSAFALPDGHEGSLADWLRTAVLVTVLSLGGRGVMNGTIAADGAFGEAEVAVRVAPLLITLAVVGVTAATSARAERRAGSEGRGHRLVRVALVAVIGGLGLALLALLATTSDFYGLDLAEEMDVGGGHISLGAGALGALVGGTVVMGAAAALGRAWAHRSTQSSPSTEPSAARSDFGVVLRTLRTFGLTLFGAAAVAFAGYGIYSLVTADHLDDSLLPAVISAVVLFVNAAGALSLAALGVPAGVTAHSSGTTAPLSSWDGADASGNTWSFTLFDHPWWLLVLLLPLVVSVLTAIRRTVREPYRPVTTRAVKLGAAVGAATALGVALLVRMSFHASVAGSGHSSAVDGAGFADGDIGFSLLWAPLLGAVWATLLLGVRRSGPTLVLSLPRWVVRVVGGRSTSPEWSAALTGTAPPPAGHRSTPIRVCATVLGALLTVGVLGGGIAVLVLNATVYGPKAAATAYLDDVARGDLAAALEHVGTPPDVSREPLLSDTVLSSDDFTPIRDVAVRGVHEGARSTTVSVSYLVGNSRVEDTVRLVPGERRWGLLATWQVTDPFATVEIDAPDVAIKAGGQRLVADTLLALPGRYTFHPEANEMLKTEDKSLAVTGQGRNVLSLSATVKPEVMQAARAAIDARVQSCAQSTELPASGCPFDVSEVWTDATLTVDRLPTYSLSYDRFSGRLEIISTGGGTYTLEGTKTIGDSYFFDEPYSYETYDSGTFSLQGNVSFVGDTLMVNLTY